LSIDIIGLLLYNNFCNSPVKFFKGEYGMKATNIRESGGQYEIIVVSEPSRFAKFLGAKPQTITYRGSGTVWHEFPSGTRAPTYVESFLSNTRVAYSMKNDTSFST
jgi:hypothetical protein